MISISDFKTINKEVENSINDTLDRVKILSKENYITYLADGEYVPEIDIPSNSLNPNLIDYTIDQYKDQTRLSFLTNFMSAFYSFSNGQTHVLDDENRINIELMIYCHIWESRRFLKRLNRLAMLIKGQNYLWEVLVPIMSKHKFIRIETRDHFDKSNCPLGKIITNGFHTSLRNAFAHSEYSFDIDQNKILLHDSKYNKNVSWKLNDITFNDWTKTFIHSALLSYHLLYISQQRRKSLINDFGTNIFSIFLPSKKDSQVVKRVNIIYNAQYDRFNFQNNK